MATPRMESSPKSSPARGSRSPATNMCGGPQDTTGTLRTKITLGKNPSILHSGPFYLMKPELPIPPPGKEELTGSTNLMAHYGLEHSYNKFSGKKVKEPLSAFLPHLPGNIDTSGKLDNSSLRGIIEKPPVCGKEIINITSSQMSGFRLHPGRIAEQYRHLCQTALRKKKKKRDRADRQSTIAATSAAASLQQSGSGPAAGTPLGTEATPAGGTPALAAAGASSASLSSAAANNVSSPASTVGGQADLDSDSNKRPHKKRKKDTDDLEKRKRKKEKKKKKEKYHGSPPHHVEGQKST